MSFIFTCFSKISWASLESFLNEEIPFCVKQILHLCGYDTMFSLAQIKNDQIIKIERHINDHCLEYLDFNCCHSAYYKEHLPFELLPGHKTMILSMPRNINDYNRSYQTKLAEMKGRYSFVLNELIQTAESKMIGMPLIQIQFDILPLMFFSCVENRATKCLDQTYPSHQQERYVSL